MSSVKDRFKKIRMELGFTQDQMADLLNLGKATVQNYEYGKTTPSLAILDILAKKHGINANWILYGQGGMYNTGLDLSESAHFPPTFCRSFLHGAFDQVLNLHLAAGKSMPDGLSAHLFTEVEGILQRAQTEREAALMLENLIDRFKNTLASK